MKAQDLMLDTIAHNLANVNTTGYKNSRANFQDMLYTALAEPGSAIGDAEIPAGIQIGHGTRVVSVSKMFTQGALKSTEGQLDLGLEGDGFFEILLPDGTSAYTRDGSFRINSAGEVVTPDGYRVANFDAIDQGTTEITIASDGSFTTVVDGMPVIKARLTLVRFMNPEGLRAIGRNLFTATDASGDAQTGMNPGENGTATIAQGYLETSNVSVVEELVNMITAQRAYEANTKAIKTTDEMMGQVNNLKR